MAEVLRYPLSLIDKDTDYLQIGIVKYEPSGFTRGDEVTLTSTGTSTTAASTIRGRPFNPTRGQRTFNNKTYDTSIILPIPSNIQDGNSVNFGPGSLDGLTAQAAGIALDAFDSGKDITQVGEILADTAKTATSMLFSGGAREYFLRGLAASAANIPFGGNLSAAQLLARESSTGQILNPNMELLFEGVNLRSFKFSFKMTPRNQKEAKRIRDIIFLLKKSMCPSGAGSLYLETPKIFELTYKKGGSNHPYLHRFKQCALTDMSVNYTGEGVYATYADGSPISYIMDLGFKELEPIYEGDYPGNADDQIGVGY
jgi:hypothetical protein